MNGQSTVSHPTTNTEQLVGKFHVEKLSNNAIGSHEETVNVPVQQPAPILSAVTGAPTDESACASRFQMIRVDRNFGRGRWKVNDYEPPENNTSATMNPPVTTIDNEPVNSSNSLLFSTLTTPVVSTTATIPMNVPLILPGDSNATLAAAAAAAASAAAAAALQQQQLRLALNNPATAVPTANVPNPTNMLHAYSAAALSNMPGPNQPYMLPNHHQFSYYPFYPSLYGPYAAQLAALAAANSYMAPPSMSQLQQMASQLPPGALGEPLRHMDAVADATSENPAISSNPFSNLTADHLQNAHMAASSFMYAAHHPHSNYLPQHPPGVASPYANIASYHTAQPLSLANAIDMQQQSYPAPSQQQQQQQQQQVPTMTSPKQDVSSVKTPILQSTSITLPRTATTTMTQTKPANGIPTDTLKSTNPTPIADLLSSSSPSIITSQQHQPSLLSPITVQTINPNNNNNNGVNKTQTASLNDIWPYTSAGSPLNLSQAAVDTAAIGLLHNESGKSTEIENEILKGLATPTKQNNTTDIDNKISAAMDLVKMHLLSAVREEVTELRQQIRTLNEKVNSAEHENAFLRQCVSSETYAQYTPLCAGSTGVIDSTSNMTTTTTTAVATSAPTLPQSLSISTSQSIPMASLSSLPGSSSVTLPPPAASSSTSNASLSSAPLPSVNLPPI